MHHEAIILTLGQTPSWAAAGSTDPPTNISNWNDYVDAVATRYKGEIRYWEIWNEVDVEGSSAFYSGTIKELVSLTQAANQDLKAIYPSNVVLSPNFTTDGLDSLSQFLNDGGGKDIDVLAVHLYPNTTPEEDRPFIDAVEGMMRNAGIDKALWNTEGASGVLISPNPVAAGLLARTYILQWAWGISNFDWYCWDLAIGSPLSQSGYVTPTAAGIAYEQIGIWLRGASMLSVSQANDGTWTVALRRSNGSLAYAVWNINGNRSLPVPGDWTVKSTQNWRGDRASYQREQWKSALSRCFSSPERPVAAFDHARHAG